MKGESVVTNQYQNLLTMIQMNNLNLNCNLSLKHTLGKQDTIYQNQKRPTASNDCDDYKYNIISIIIVIVLTAQNIHGKPMLMVHTMAIILPKQSRQEIKLELRK